MAEEVPVSEVRRVVIQYEIQLPRAPARSFAPSPQPDAPPPELDIEELAEKVRRELVRTGRRNGDIFGGTA